MLLLYKSPSAGARCGAEGRQGRGAGVRAGEQPGPPRGAAGELSSAARGAIDSHGKIDILNTRFSSCARMEQRCSCMNISARQDGCVSVLT